MTDTEFHDEITALLEKLESLSRTPSAEQNFGLLYQTLVTQWDSTGLRDIRNEYLRFVVSGFAMHHFMFTRELTEMHRWLILGLSEEYKSKQEQEAHVERVFDFIESPQISQYIRFNKILIMWLGALYYYCAEQAALDNFGEYYLPLVVNTLSQIPFSVYDLAETFLLSRSMTWTVQTNRKEGLHFTKLNEKLALDKSAPLKCRALAISGLTSNTGRLSRKPRTYWADYGLTNLQDSFSTQDILQLLQLTWDSKPGKKSKKIVNKFRKLRHDIEKEALTQNSLRLLEDGRSELLKPALVRAIEHGNTAFAHEVISIWYNVEKSQAPPVSGILWQIPVNSGGFLLAVSNRVALLKRDTQEELIKLTAAANHFLGTSVSVRGTPSDTLHIPDRLGYPTHAIAEEFKEALASSYLPAGAIEFIRENNEVISQQLIIPSKPHPIQPLQLYMLGTSWPLTASFRKPFRDAPIKKVALWVAGGVMGQDYEVKLVREIFENQGIIVDVFEAEGNENVVSFTDVYADPAYDVLWMTSHGEYDHFSPKNAQLVLGQGKTIAIDELLACTLDRADRRLLVLNVCDGGTHPGEGVLPHIGFAASLASPRQATISHKWPVAALPAAAFGSLLALQLCRNDGYFNAYKGTILKMIDAGRDGNGIAADLLNATREAADFMERLKFSPNGINEFAHYGSAAFFE